jgi:hypothetical protein
MGLLKPDPTPDSLFLVGRGESAESLAKFADLNSETLIYSLAWRSALTWLQIVVRL